MVTGCSPQPFFPSTCLSRDSMAGCVPVLPCNSCYGPCLPDGVLTLGVLRTLLLGVIPEMGDQPKGSQFQFREPDLLSFPKGTVQAHVEEKRGSCSLNSPKCDRGCASPYPPHGDGWLSGGGWLTVACSSTACSHHLPLLRVICPAEENHCPLCSCPLRVKF